MRTYVRVKEFPARPHGGMDCRVFSVFVWVDNNLPDHFWYYLPDFYTDNDVKNHLFGEWQPDELDVQFRLFDD